MFSISEITLLVGEVDYLLLHLQEGRDHTKHIAHVSPQVLACSPRTLIADTQHLV